MSNWVCRSCYREASRIRTIMDESGPIDQCEHCGTATIELCPDVYFRKAGQTFQALCDENGKPIPIMSKRHKKEVMDRLGVRECPERLSEKNWIEGTRETRRKSFENDRPKIKEIYNQYLRRRSA